MKIGEKLGTFIVLYRSPSQSQDEFETFLKNFELNLDTILLNNSFLTVVLGDFNVSETFDVKVTKHHTKAQKSRAQLLNFECNN